MVTEKWEADLRRQLGVKFKSEQWEQNLEKDIQEKPAAKPNSIWLILMLIFLGCAIVFAYDQKTGGTLENWIISKFEKPDVAVCEKDNSQSNNTENKNYDSDINSIKNAIAKLEESNKSTSEIVQKSFDRLTLIGVMLNENFMIVRNNYPREHLIFFNRDWTLDRMPTYIKFSEEDKEFLNKFVRP